MKDTIYRENAIKIVHHYFSELIDLLPTTKDSEGEELIIDTHKCKEYLMMNKVLSGLISELPSVEPKTGEWLKAMEGNAYRDKCSLCLATYPIAYGYKYCPNCGSKMRE